MASIPPRDSRVLQTVDQLQQEILSGALQGPLPGERELARQLRIGRVTLRSALKILEEKQWVSISKPGVRRTTLKRPQKQGASTQKTQANYQGKVVVTLAPQDLADLPTNERLNYARLQAYCSSAKVTLRHRKLDTTHLKNPDHRLREFIKQNPADLYLLQLVNQETQLWFSNEKISSIVLGSVWPDCDLPSVDYDQKALGLHAASTLSRLGHKKVGILYPTPERQGLKLFQQGFLAAAVETELVLTKMEDSPESVSKALHSLISNTSKQVTAIILPRIPYAISATTKLANSGVNTPKDISLLCLVYDELLKYTHPPIAGYDISIDQFPKAIFDLIVDKLLHPETVSSEATLVMPNFIPADSLAIASTSP